MYPCVPKAPRQEAVTSVGLLAYPTFIRLHFAGSPELNADASSNLDILLYSFLGASILYNIIWDVGEACMTQDFSIAVTL